MSEASTVSTAASGSDPLEWQFLQCFGERTPGEEIQEGQKCHLSQLQLLAAQEKQQLAWLCLTDSAVLKLQS